MATRPAPQVQRLTPYLIYADAPAAIAFLVKAFGFRERFRFPMPDGRVGHAELTYEGSVLMLASGHPEMGFVSARGLPGVHSQVVCVVDDVDAHHDRAKEAGAAIAGPPKAEHGSRSYRAVDPEGHRWIFSAPARPKPVKKRKRPSAAGGAPSRAARTPRRRRTGR